MSEKKDQKNTGFTLVETMVAISILSISILATFTAVQAGLKTSIYAEKQETSFYLAQEAMEYVRNIRDSNAIADIAAMSSGGARVNWLNKISAVSTDPCYFGNTCTIDSPQNTMAKCSGSWGSCPYLNQDSVSGLFGYSNTSGWFQSGYKREIQITSVSPNEMTVTVSVSWSGGSIKVNQELLNTRP